MSRFQLMINSMARRKFLRKHFILTSLMLGIGACVLQIIGVVGPSWIYIEKTTNTNPNLKPKWYLQEGLWLAKYCINFGNYCRTDYRENIMDDIPDYVMINANPGTHWLEFQILSIISIISSVTTVLTLYCIQRRHDLKYDQPVLIVSGLFSVLSCTTLLIPEVKTWFVNNSATLVTAWSRTIAFLGTLMQFITTIILLFAIYRTRISKLERDRKHERRRREMIKTRVIVVTDENPWSTNVEQTRTSDENIQNVPMTLVAHEIKHNKTKTGESQPRKNTQESFADFTNNEIINPDKDEITTATENVGPVFNQSSEETKSNLDNSRPSKVKDISQSNVNNDPFSLSNESTI